MKAQQQFLGTAPRSRARRARALVALLAAGAATTLASAAFAPGGTASAASLPSFRLGVRSVDVSAGSSATIEVRFSANRRGAFRWSFADLPASVTPDVTCNALRACTLTLTVAPNAGDSTSLVDVIAQSGSTRRVASFALGIHALATTPTTTPTTPTATPTTTPPTTPTTAAPAKTFVLRPTALIASTQPGGTVAFPISIVRSNWNGPVSMSLDSLPAGWRAAFVPENPVNGASTTLLLSVPSGAPTTDTSFRFVGRSDTWSAEATVVVRVRLPQLSLVVTSAPSVAAGSSVQFVLDARSVDDPTLPVTLGVEGLPSTVSSSFTSNPVAGTVGVTFGVPLSLSPGSYAFTFTASRDGVVVRVPAILVVTPSVVSSTFVFTPTYVPPVSGDVPGYALAASTGAPVFVRGVTSIIDVTVAPKGGFVSPINVMLNVPAGWVVGYSTIATNVFRITVTVPSSSGVGTISVPLVTSSGALNATLALTGTVT